MLRLPLHDFHAARGAKFLERNNSEIVASYTSAEAEYRALTSAAALVDLSYRSRLCLLGADREKFLHGQVTNDVVRLATGQGTYGALVTAKGKLQTDLFIYKLADELLLDFEAGLAETVQARLEKYVIAEDVQIVDVAPHYGLLSIQGPRSREALESVSLVPNLPTERLSWTKSTLPNGDLYITHNGRFGSPGFDCFVPIADLPEVFERLAAVTTCAGHDACEIARIENGIPRFGVDMDDSNLAPEALDEQAISYAKGCYIGQEVIARIRTYGQVAKALRLVRLPSELPALPHSKEKLFRDGKEVGFITSSALSPKHGSMVALGYLRKEANALGEKLKFGSPDGGTAEVIGLPWKG